MVGKDARIVYDSIDTLTCGGFLPEVLDSLWVSEVGLNEGVTLTFQGLSRCFRGPDSLVRRAFEALRFRNIPLAAIFRDIRIWANQSRPRHSTILTQARCSKT